jgi:hypothetical protein
MDKSIAEQVKAASQEAIASARASAQLTDTDNENKTASQVDSSDSSATKPAYLSVISDEEWAAASSSERAKLIKFSKAIYSDYQQKNKEISPLRQLQAEMDEDPNLAATIKKAVSDYRNGSISNSQSKPSEAKTAAAVSEAEDLIDELKNSDDPKVRIEARKLEAAIEKRLAKVSDSALKGEIEALKAMVNDLKGYRADSHQNAIASQLDQLSEAWTPALDKYREKILARAANRPELGLDYLLMLTLKPEEYRAAVVADEAIKSRKQANRVKQDPTNGRVVDVGSEKSSTEQPSHKSQFGKRLSTKSLIAKILPDIKRSMPSA